MKHDHTGKIESRIKRADDKNNEGEILFKFARTLSRVRFTHHFYFVSETQSRRLSFLTLSFAERHGHGLVVVAAVLVLALEHLKYDILVWIR